MAKMMFQKGNTWLAVFAGLLIVAATIGGYLWWQKNQTGKAEPVRQVNYPTTISNPKPTEASTSANETANWKTFINFDSNYTVKYSDVVGSTCGGELIHFHPPDDCNDITAAGLRISVISNTVKWSLQKLVSEIEKRSTVEQQSSVKVADREAIKLTLANSLPDGPYVQSNGETAFGGSAISKIVAIYLLTPKGDFMRITYDLETCSQQRAGLGVKELPCTPVTVKDIEKAEVALATMKFFNTDELASNIEKYWLKYRDESAGLEIKYPSDWKADEQIIPSSQQNYIVFRWDDSVTAENKLEPFENRNVVDFSILISDQEQDLTKIESKTFPNGYIAKKLGEVEVGGEKAVEAVLESKEMGSDDYLKGIFFNHKGRLWTITFYYDPTSKYSDPEFLQMLSSFKFL